MILKNHISAPIRKEKLSPTSKVRRKVSRNKFMKTNGMPDGVESFVDVDSSEKRPRTRPRSVKAIQNGLRKKQNLVEGRPSRAETGLVGEKMELDSRKKSRRDRTTPSKSFETLEVREISQKQLIGFFILWMGTIEHVFWMEGKDRKEQEILKI